MAHKKISELTELFVPSHSDLIPIVSGAETKKITLSNLIGDKYVRSTRFEIISAGSSGSVTLPPDSEVVLDDFGGTVDAVISKVDGGKPTTFPAKTGNIIVATTFDSGGNWVLSSVPDVYPVAIIYRVRQKIIDFDSTASNIWGNTNSEQLTKAELGLGNVPNVDATNPANISQSSSYRFVTDTEKSTWNAKIGDSYETVSKNLRAYPYTLNYTAGVLTSIVYNLGGGLQITKTLNYTGPLLTSIVLSGDTPAGTLLTKTLSYTGNDLTSISYS